VNSDNLDYYSRALTNTANILDKFGRNYESIHAYEKILNVDPNFGMALGNKAQALDYYNRLSPKLSLTLMTYSSQLINKALNDERVLQIGGKVAIDSFNEYKKFYKEFFITNNISSSIPRLPKSTSKYHKFVLKQNLFLNFDFGLYYNEESLSDNFFPNFIDDIQKSINSRTSIMSDKIYFCFHIFNQLLEDFTTARSSFYRAIYETQEVDKSIQYIYTYDYSSHSEKHGLLKSVFATLYNTLDKIAHLIKFYFHDDEINSNNIDIYFDWLTTQDFKEIIKNSKNYQLLALLDLALDFKPNGQYFKFNKVRNRITHSFLSITELFYTQNKDYVDFEIDEDSFIQNIHQLFIIVKAAIMYSIIAIYHENKEELPASTAIFQNDLF
ncbi:MAG: hypothetical protein ACI86H_000557, partial [bacterium]